MWDLECPKCQQTDRYLMAEDGDDGSLYCRVCQSHWRYELGWIREVGGESPGR